MKDLINKELDKHMGLMLSTYESNKFSTYEDAYAILALKQPKLITNHSEEEIETAIEEWFNN